jgi:hypothetical protein
VSPQSDTDARDDEASPKGGRCIDCYGTPRDLAHGGFVELLDRTVHLVRGRICGVVRP